ncbi:MAG: DUF2892 domain-containing protein [Bacteroidota bacterium]
MKKNVGTIDKVARILVAVIISILYFTNQISGTLGIILLVLGGVFILTSFISFCPIYSVFGWSSKGKTNK